MTLNYSSPALFPAASSPSRLPPDGGGFIPSFFGEEDFVWEFLTNPNDCASGWRSGKSGGGATKVVKATGCASELPPPLATSACDDIVDLLPADPFGMGLAGDTDTWTAAIAGWIEDLAATVVDNFGYYDYVDHYSQFGTPLDYFVFCRSAEAAAMDTAANSSLSFAEECTIGSPLCSFEAVFTGQPPLTLSDMEECEHGQPSKMDGHCVDGLYVDSNDSSVPHDALLFALSYLDIPDLLSVERVCKTLYLAVRGDPLLWRHIHVGPPLSKNITDEVLLRLTGRAKGSLECLSLTECSQVTDSGLRCVLENNPRLKKLNVPACMRLSIGGVVDILKQVKSTTVSSNGPGIMGLGIGGLYGITHEHLEALNGLLGPRLGARKPLFYHLRRITLCHDMGAIDVEECPKCRHVRVVYDCPVSNCRAQGLDPCRACSICIERCNQCGKCIHGHDYEETFALDWVCLSCMNGHAPMTQPRMDLCQKISTV